jgi:predicted CXXCH cytochrome family protein
MKRLLFGLALGMLMAAGFAGVAMADNGPHGSFTATTDACASCHRVHTAQVGSNSLLKVNPEELCLSCHDGTGAGTNVENGVYSVAHSNGASEGTDGASLFGGGFTNAVMATAWSGKVTFDAAYNAASKATTSTHSLGTTGTVWGSGAVNTANGSLALECTSCHDPHGTAGYTNTGATNTGWLANACDPSKTANPCTTKVASYRLLRWQPQGSNGFTAPSGTSNWSGGAFPGNTTMTTGTTGWTVPDNFSTLGQEWYTIGTTGAFANGDYNAGNANNVYNVKNPAAAAGTNIPAGINEAFFCAQCHDRYFNNSRLRNATDASAYCGAPTAGVVVNGVTLTQYAPVLNTTTGFYEHPVDPGRCEVVGNATTAGGITGWGDNGPSGDLTYTYRHASGDIRTSSDGTNAQGAGTSLSRSCAACHVSHGTTAASTALASSSTLAGDSALLRMDNRSVCLRCHASDIGFVVGP